ncbi:uncharacterized protein LOC124499161 [Dermatophagoides farinae]|uniref:uncharacterized protein LOC124499161 n=1 Tax=Dermatophagoides farinae TaxID=6954 RepID=UPI003F5F4EFC
MPTSLLLLSSSSISFLFMMNDNGDAFVVVVVVANNNNNNNSNILVDDDHVVVVVDDDDDDENDCDSYQKIDWYHQYRDDNENIDDKNIGKQQQQHHQQQQKQQKKKEKKKKESKRPTAICSDGFYQCQNVNKIFVANHNDDDDDRCKQNKFYDDHYENVDEFNDVDSEEKIVISFEKSGEKRSNCENLNKNFHSPLITMKTYLKKHSNIFSILKNQNNHSTMTKMDTNYYYHHHHYNHYQKSMNNGNNNMFYRLMFIFCLLIIINIFIDNNHHHFCLAIHHHMDEIDSSMATETAIENSLESNIQTFSLSPSSSSSLLFSTIPTIRTTSSIIDTEVSKIDYTTTATLHDTDIMSILNVYYPYNLLFNELNDNNNDSTIIMTTTTMPTPSSQITSNYFESIPKPLHQKQLPENDKSSSPTSTMTSSDIDSITFSSDSTTTKTTTTLTVVTSLSNHEYDRNNNSVDIKNNTDPGFMELTVVDHAIILIGGSLSLITILGNVLVMVAFKIDRQLQTISNYFLLSLAVADFLIGFISMPLSLIYIVADGWPLGYSICDIWLAIDYLNSNASVLNLLLISFDRYFSVTRPLTYRAKRTTRRACIFISFAWIVSALLWPPWIFAWPKIEGRRTVPEHQCYIPFLESNIWVTTITAIMAFWIPVTIMCILYWRIWRETENRYRELTSLVVISPATTNQPTATIATTTTTSITKSSTPTASGTLTGGTNIALPTTSDSRSKIKLKSTTNNSPIGDDKKCHHQNSNQNQSTKAHKRPSHLPNCPRSLIYRNKVRTSQIVVSTATSQQEIGKDSEQQKTCGFVRPSHGRTSRLRSNNKTPSISIVGRAMSHTSIGQQSYVEPAPKIFSTHDYGDEIKLEDIPNPTEGLVCLKSPATIVGQDLDVEDYENELLEIAAAASATDIGSIASESRRSSLTFLGWIWNRLTFNNTRHKRCSSDSSKHSKRSQLKKKYSIQELQSGVVTATETTSAIKCPGCAYRLRRLRRRRQLQKMKQIRQQKSLELEQPSTNIRPRMMDMPSKSIDHSLDMSTIKQTGINYHIREMESINDDNTQSDSSIYTIVIKLQDPKDFNHHDNQRSGESIKMLRSHRSKRSSSTSSSAIRQDSATGIISDELQSISIIAKDNKRNVDRQEQLGTNNIDECHVYIDDNYDINDDNLEDDDYDDDDLDDDIDDEYDVVDGDGDDDGIINVDNNDILDEDLQTNVFMYTNDDDDDNFDEDDDDFDEDNDDDIDDNNDNEPEQDDEDDSDSSIQIKNCCTIRCVKSNSNSKNNQQNQPTHTTPVLVAKQQQQPQQRSKINRQPQGSMMTTKSSSININTKQQQQQQQHGAHILQHQQSTTTSQTSTTMTPALLSSSAAFTRVRATFQPKSERKAAKTLSAILLAFIVTWTPYNVLGK